MLTHFSWRKRYLLVAVFVVVGFFVAAIVATQITFVSEKHKLVQEEKAHEAMEVVLEKRFLEVSAPGCSPTFPQPGFMEACIMLCVNARTRGVKSSTDESARPAVGSLAAARRRRRRNPTHTLRPTHAYFPLRPIQQSGCTSSASLLPEATNNLPDRLSSRIAFVRACLRVPTRDYVFRARRSAPSWRTSSAGG